MYFTKKNQKGGRGWPQGKNEQCIIRDNDE